MIDDFKLPGKPAKGTSTVDKPKAAVNEPAFVAPDEIADKETDATNDNLESGNTKPMASKTPNKSRKRFKLTKKQKLIGLIGLSVAIVGLATWLIFFHRLFFLSRSDGHFQI